MEMFNPAHPGRILKEYIMDYSVTDIAQRLGVTRVTLSRIINGKAPITSEMAMRLSKLLPNTSPKFWLGMQSQYDIWQLKQQAMSFDVQPLYIPKTEFSEERPSA